MTLNFCKVYRATSLESRLGNDMEATIPCIFLCINGTASLRAASSLFLQLKLLNAFSKVPAYRFCPLQLLPVAFFDSIAHLVLVVWNSHNLLLGVVSFRGFLQLNHGPSNLDIDGDVALDVEECCGYIWIQPFSRRSR
jgi:hypothetical protein